MAVLNPKQFNNEVASFLKDVVEPELVQVHKFITLELLRRVILKSPVGNAELWAVNRERSQRGQKLIKPRGYVGGRFRSNWHLTRMVPSDKTVDEIVDQSESIITGEIALAVLGPYEITFVQNALPYAERIEEGWSTQAPQGVLNQAIGEVQLLFGD